MYNERLHTKDLLQKMNDSYMKLLTDLESMFEGIKKAKETDRTMDYKTQRMVSDWFNKHGNIPI